MLNRLIGLLSSLKLTVACLGLLMILVTWGTLYQVEYGLWAAQQRFFYSWFFRTLGFIWLPGGQLVMSALFVNLLVATLHRIPLGWKQAGLVLIHVGLLLLLAGGWVTRRFGEEAFLTLNEGETSNVASSYRDWEIAAWEDQGSARRVSAVQADGLRSGQELVLEEPGLTLHIDRYYPDARAFMPDEGKDSEILNASGIGRLEPGSGHPDPERNLPGAVLTVTGRNETSFPVLLFGGDTAPTVVPDDDRGLRLQLRRKRHPLPVTITLVDFHQTYHPNSKIAESFSSDIRVDVKGVVREVMVEMNLPFRYRDYTFYQASFAELGDGAEQSTFAVTRNAGRLLPYIATGLVVAGLIIHFMYHLILRQVKRRRPAGT